MEIAKCDMCWAGQHLLHGKANRRYPRATRE
jgi:hypothetical protein